MPNARRIYLTGFMGSGKSVVGSKLAERLLVPFLDLDALIVERTGKPIRQIFADEGEDAFRRVEEEALRQTALRDRAVIAVGGGALARSEGMQYARANGIVVYLKASADELATRLMHGQQDRPMLRSSDGRPLGRSALKERISELLAHREPVYAKSDIIVETDGHSVSQVVDSICARLSDWRASGGGPDRRKDRR